MADRQTKDMKILVKSVILSDRQTSRGGKMFNVNFEVGGMANRAVTFSETIASELEKALNTEVPVQMEVGEFNGMPSYTIKTANGVATSGFKGGKKFEKDVVSIERQKSSDIAERLMQYVTMDAEQDPKNVLAKFRIVADGVYEWISTRPVTSQASGGAPAQRELPPVDIYDNIDTSDFPQ